MGAKLSPIVATVVMHDLLDRIIHKMPFNSPFLLKDVDDLALALPKQHVNDVSEIFNSFDTHIKFSIKMIEM